MEEFKPYAVLAIIVAIVILLVVDRIRTALVFFAGVILLYVSGIADTNLLLESFSNQSIITIFLLILLTAVVQDNYNLIGALDTLFKKAQSPRKFLFRMTFSVGSVSSIMNNTPIVALMIPYVYQWSRKAKTAPSKLMIPLSFAAILGGMITPIGTSTNLVLIGFLRSAGDPLLGLSDFILPGILVLIVGPEFWF
jgi:di/tricarboxylate transporter